MFLATHAPQRRPLAITMNRKVTVFVTKPISFASVHTFKNIRILVESRTHDGPITLICGHNRWNEEAQKMN